MKYAGRCDSDFDIHAYLGDGHARGWRNAEDVHRRNAAKTGARLHEGDRVLESFQPHHILVYMENPDRKCIGAAILMAVRDDSKQQLPPSVQALQWQSALMMTAPLTVNSTASQ